MPRKETESVRPLVDKVGFAHNPKQMETFLERMRQQQGELLETKRAAHNITKNTRWRVALCPHDDYTYTGYLYPLVLQQVKSKTIFIIAVAHKAAMFNLENKLIFDDYTCWHGIHKPVPVSHLRAELLQRIEGSMREVHRPMQQTEHSVEAMLPFIQYYNPGAEIVPVLVPFMPFEKIQTLAEALSSAIHEIAFEHKLSWGNDFSILITTDSVHYGDEGWNGKNCDRFGTGKAGYNETLAYEYSIIDECLEGEITEEKVRSFYNYMVDPHDFHKYKWTWCGRYAVPLGLLTSLELAKKLKEPIPQGAFLDYSTSIAHQPIPVTDLEGMGTTADANLRHWVGYTAMGYV